MKEMKENFVKNKNKKNKRLTTEMPPLSAAFGASSALSKRRKEIQ